MFTKSVAVAGASLLAAVSSVSAATTASFSYGTPNPTRAGVVSKGTNGPTNPDTPSLGTAINQSE